VDNVNPARNHNVSALKIAMTLTLLAITTVRLAQCLGYQVHAFQLIGQAVLVRVYSPVQNFLDVTTLRLLVIPHVRVQVPLETAFQPLWDHAITAI